jgi:hypothetical protein
MFAHGGNEVLYTDPVSRDSEEPLEYGMRGVKLVIERLEVSVMLGDDVYRSTYALVELSRDRLARHQTTLADQQFAVRIEGGNSKHDLLCAVLEHPFLTLLEEAKKEAYCAGKKTLKIVSASAMASEVINLPGRGQ